MNFTLTDEQNLLRASLGQFLQHRYGFAERTAASRGETGYRAEIWSALANELGVLGMTIPEANGGLGGGAVEQMILMEEAGRALLLEPVSETLFQAGWLLEQAGGALAEQLLPQIAGGALKLAVALGEPDMRYDLADISTRAVRAGTGWRLDGVKAMVMAAPWADRLIVPARTSGQAGDADGLSLFVVDPAAAGVKLHPYPTIDGRRAADIELAGVTLPVEAQVGPVGGALALLEEVRDRAIAAQAAEAAGLLDKLLADTVEYTKQRQQFGQPISSFQVLQHRMVDMYMQVEMVRSAAVLAALKLDGDPAERAKAASAAKVTVANACRFIGQNAVQLHGGMGMTDELPIGHYFKRATLIESEHGTADWHLARHAALSAV
ncbi:acyl-CoA dehydrogenase family protein [Novosphingobium aquiterrae]|uniref:Acyl-CoA dehydrogenase family protein n=1 Tax=Novosphingobium aquiterrae TaxID=624388 RepID=A0ABV6PEJ6_9SPHN